ncbi:hypothetical protein BHE74_00039444 [Ensete ventricosum]|nr:hypothetical protein BHE74_00039444 [Ensete ventricosum]
MYLPMGSCTSTILQKNVTVINFAQSRADSQVLTDFSCTIMEFQNIGHSLRISTLEVVQAWFHEKNTMVINIAQKSPAQSSFDWFFMQHLRILKYWSFPTY